MNAKLIRLITAICLVSVTLTVTSCGRRVPLNENQAAAVFTVSRGDLKREQVRRAIIAGANDKGWRVQEIDHNHLLATVEARSRMAQVTIEYSAKSYSIRYKDSRRLGYSADKSTIHPRYKRWVRNLALSINKRLNTM